MANPKEQIDRLKAKLDADKSPPVCECGTCQQLAARCDEILKQENGDCAYWMAALGAALFCRAADAMQMAGHVPEDINHAFREGIQIAHRYGMTARDVAKHFEFREKP